MIYIKLSYNIYIIIYLNILYSLDLYINKFKISAT